MNPGYLQKQLHVAGTGLCCTHFPGDFCQVLVQRRAKLQLGFEDVGLSMLDSKNS